MTKLPSVISSMSLAKRCPEGPRCVSWLPKALCILQFTLVCAKETVDTAAKASATAAAPHCDGLIICPPPLGWRMNHSSAFGDFTKVFLLQCTYWSSLGAIRSALTRASSSRGIEYPPVFLARRGGLQEYRALRKPLLRFPRR